MLTICLDRKEHYAGATKQVRNRDQEIVKFNDTGQEVRRELEKQVAVHRLSSSLRPPNGEVVLKPPFELAQHRHILPQSLRMVVSLDDKSVFSR